MLRKTFFGLFLVLILTSPLTASVTNLEKPYVVLKSRPGGMFSLFNDVLLLINMYDNKVYSGAAVKFDDHGFYFDVDHGHNWWNYYCEPIGLGRRFQRTIVDCDGFNLPYSSPRRDMQYMNRQDAARLVSKYIHPLPFIEQKVADFAKQHFKGKYVIGVHYRGTDKVLEAPRVTYEEMGKKVMEIVHKKQRADYVVFVATDEAPFLEYMKKQHPHNIAYWDAIRSDTHRSVHKHQTAAPYRLGEDAMMDCLLLAESDLLVRTASNLSLWSGYFNPKMKVIDMNHGYRR